MSENRYGRSPDKPDLQNSLNAYEAGRDALLAEISAAVSLGYKCLMLADCCGAVNDDLHRWLAESVKIENDVFDMVTAAQVFINGLTQDG